MTDYNPADDAAKGYEVAIAHKRAKLLMEQCPAAKRVEVIGSCVLYLGDCLEIMPSLEKVDAVVTDPPYGIEGIVGGYGRAGRTIQNDKDLNTMARAFRLLVEHQRAYWLAAFFSPRVAPAFHDACGWMTWRGEIVWNKKAPGMGAGLRYQHETIGLFSVGEVQPLGSLFSVQDYYRQGDVHPHEKPVGLMRQLLDVIPGHTILDPFAGSGTTIVACARMGKAGVGIELDEDYFNIACKRIREAYSQPDLFIEAEKPKPEQTSFLDGGEAA